MKLEELKEAVEKFFADTSRSPTETRDGLEEVSDLIEILCDTLPAAD